MSVATLLKESTHESIIPVRWPALAGGAPTGNAILALDLGQKTGWAVRASDSAIASGTVELRPRFEGGGMVLLRFRAWLQEVDETAGGVCAVYFEEVRFHRGVTAAQVHGGFLAHLTAWAEMFKIPYRGVPVGTIKRHVTGRGNADKDAVIAAVRARLRPRRRQRGRCPRAARLGARARRPAMNGSELLEHAAGLVNRRRRESGEPADLFEQVAARWSLTLGTRISPAHVVPCLIDLKLARLAEIPSTSTARSRRWLRGVLREVSR